MKQLKRRLVTLMLAAALCLGLAVPALAVDASGLDAATAKAYANVLNAQIAEYGIRESTERGGIQYAGLEDMDANGTPELIIINCAAYQFVNISIWTIQGGQAVQMLNEQDVACGSDYGEIYYTRKDAQTKLYCCGMSSRMGQAWDWYELIGPEGVTAQDNKEMIEGQYGWESALNKDTAWIKDNSPLISGNGMTWTYDESQASAVRMLQSSLKSQASQVQINQSQTPAPTGNYGPLTISGTYYTITFKAAILSKTTIQYCYHESWVETHSGAKDYPVTMITVYPGSEITIISTEYTDDLGANFITVDRYFSDENGVYHTDWGQSDVEAIWSGTANTSYFYGDSAIELPQPAADGTPYLLVRGSDTPVTSNQTTVNGFTDVSSTAYYASAVTWAVGKGITNGTGTNKFSPENTCNNAEILTFIWRAKGQPEPAVSNPFSNVKSSDYYYKAALWAYQNGLVTGSSFNASAPCTRSMAVTYLWKAAGSPAAGASGFSDVSASASYAQAVAWAVNQGITNGDGANTFSPDKTCTRGQIVTFLYRAFA